MSTRLKYHLSLHLLWSETLMPARQLLRVADSLIAYDALRARDENGSSQIPASSELLLLVIDPRRIRRIGESQAVASTRLPRWVSHATRSLRPSGLVPSVPRFVWGSGRPTNLGSHPRCCSGKLDYCDDCRWNAHHDKAATPYVSPGRLNFPAYCASVEYRCLRMSFCYLQQSVFETRHRQSDPVAHVISECPFSCHLSSSSVVYIHAIEYRSPRKISWLLYLERSVAGLTELLTKE
jgi:hypothetical protein